MSFVLDASVTLGWLFVDESNAKSLAIRERVNIEGAIVPVLWRIEVVNALAVAERQRRIASDDVDRAATFPV